MDDQRIDSRERRRQRIERALRRSEERFRSVVEAAPNAMVMISAEGRIEMVNAHAERVFGYDRADMLGRPVEMLVPERFRSPHPAMRSAFFGKPQSRPMGAGRDLYALRSDGSEFPVEIGLNPIETDDGPMVLSAIVDISARKRQEKRFRSVVEAAPNAMFMVSAAGLIELVNAQAERLFGYNRTELLGKPMEILVPTRFRGRHPELRRAFTASPASRPMGAGRDLYALRRDGSEFPVEIGLNPIETDEGPMVLSSIVDITERRRLEERFRRVVEAAPNAMVMIGASGRIEMVNAQTEAMFGYPRDAMLGQDIEMLVPERFRPRHPALRGAFFGEPRSRPMGAGRDLYGLHSDGSEFPVEIGLNPIETEDGIMVLSAIVDISDRKQKEARIETALKEKDLLLAEIHHRVKNNLQVVHSLLDLQSAQISDRAVREMLRESQNRVQSMALIHQTLYQSKDFAEVDFRHFLESLTPTLLATYAVDLDRVTLDIASADVHLPINIAVPCGLVVNELISNALKHGFPGDRTGSIKAELSRVSGDELLLAVTDSGVGMREDVDIDTSATLGLQLVILLTEQLRGRLAIRRADPTRFEIHFPFEQ